MNDIIINNSNVFFGNVSNKKRRFYKSLKVGNFRFYITYKLRLRKSQGRDFYNRKEHIKIKDDLYEQNDGKCFICGKNMDKKHDCQLHHVLPWWLFPQFKYDKRNLMLLHEDCHRSIHKNPFVECRMIEEKCKELGVNVSDYYGV